MAALDLKSFATLKLEAPFWSFFSIVLFNCVLSFTVPEFEHYEEFHHISSVLTPERFTEVTSPNNASYSPYWELTEKIITVLGINKNYTDPIPYIKEKIFDEKIPIYFKLDKNQDSVIILRILQVVLLSSFSLLLCRLLFYGKNFKVALSFLVLFYSWPPITLSLGGYSSQAVADLLVPFVFLLLVSSRYFSALLVASVIIFFERQGVVIITLVIAYILVFNGLHFMCVLKDFRANLKEKLLDESAAWYAALFVSTLAILVYLLNIYNTYIISIANDLVAFLDAQIKYLHNDPVRTYGIFLLTLVGTTPSLTATSYVVFYIFFYSVLSYAIYLFYKDPREEVSVLGYAIVSILFFLIFTSLFNGLSNFRYHTYLLPVIFVLLSRVLRVHNLRPEAIVLFGMLVSLLTCFRATVGIDVG